MLTVQKDHLILAMSALYLKHLEVAEAMVKITKSTSPALAFISPSWKPLHELKGEGFAEIEYDGPVILCKLTPKGVERKAQLQKELLPH